MDKDYNIPEFNQVLYDREIQTIVWDWDVIRKIEYISSEESEITFELLRAIDNLVWWRIVSITRTTN